MKGEYMEERWMGERNWVPYSIEGW